MHGKRILTLFLLGLVLLWSMGQTLAQGPEDRPQKQPAVPNPLSPGEETGSALPQPQGAPAPQAPLSPVVEVDSAIPIQGRLTDAGGSPLADGDYSVTFRLYDASAGGVLLCSDEETVTVSSGLFSDLMGNCTSDDIDGKQVWLSVEVEGDGQMTPRQKIVPVPYAWSLRPGAIIKGDDLESVLQVENTHPGILASAVLGVSDTGTGLIGLTSSGIGVWGFSTGSGPAGYFSGDVVQDRPSDGVVKAGVYANCSSGASSVIRSFNHVSGTITIANGAGAGKCIIDFGFRIDDRYFTATPFTGASARGVSCDWGADNEKLDCFRWDTNGNGINGEIMVTIY